MAANMDAMLRIAAKVEGANAIQAFSRDLKGLDGAARLSTKDLGHMNIAINRMAREAGNTTSGIRTHISALENLRSRVDIGGKAYNRLGNEIDQLRGKLRGLDGDAKSAARSLSLRDAAASAAGTVAMGGGPMAALGAAGGTLAAAGGAVGIAAAGALALGGALTVQSVAAAKALEDQSRRLRVMTDDSAALQSGVIALVREQGYLASTTEATAAAYDILQAGFAGTDDILKIVKASTLGAAGGFTDLVTVSDALTSILNGYNRTAGDAGKIVDQIKVATDDGKISMEAYAQSIGRVVPSAAAAKLPLEEINAAISALTAQGVPVESTFSGINQAIKTILKPTEEAKDLAKALGLEFNSQALATKGLGGFLEDVAQKTGKSSDALSILFSDIDGYKAVVGLLNDDLRRFNQFTENQALAIGRASEAARIGVDPLKQYDNAWKDFSSTLGSAVLPALTEVTKAATGMLRAVMQATETIGNTATLVGGIPSIGFSMTGLYPAPADVTPPTATYRRLFNGGRAPQRNQRAQGSIGPAVPERLLRPALRAAANPPNVASALATGAGSAAGNSSAAAATPQSNLNQLLIENLRLNTELGNVGKDRISQLNAEIELIPQVLKLQLSVLNASVKGKDLQQSRINAITQARTRSAQLEEELQGVNKEVSSIAKQAAALRVSTLSGLLPKGSPLQEEVRKVKDDLLAADDAAAELLSRLSGLAGTTPAGGAARAAIGNLRGDLASADPGAIASQRLLQGDTDALRQQVTELQNAGRQLSTLEQLAMKYGADWDQIDPKIRASVGALAQQKDQLQENVNKTKEWNDTLNQAGKTIGGVLSDLVTGTNDWKSSLSGALKALANMALQSALMGLAGNDGKGVFSFLTGTLKSFDGGGYTGNRPKSGGMDGKGGFMAMLHPQETVIDHTRTMPRQGAANPINVVVNVDAKGSQVEGSQTDGAALGRVISAAVQAELVKQQRPGAILGGGRR